MSLFADFGPTTSYVSCEAISNVACRDLAMDSSHGVISSGFSSSFQLKKANL